MPRETRRAVLAGLLLAALPAGTVAAQFETPVGALFDVNRVECGVRSNGEICVDYRGSSVIGGGWWPKGTSNNYSFNSGLQLAGIIAEGNPANPWTGDTAGGFFFDPKGTTPHGAEVAGIRDARNAADLAAWPDAARVPATGLAAELFDLRLRGQAGASEGDLWWVAWEGDSRLTRGRKHPLGVVAEHRVMGWNYPEGNEDVIYVLYTLTNITSLNEAHYSGIEPAMRSLLLEQAREFHDLATAELGVDLPDGGYTIRDFYAGIGTDFDVGDASENYSGVHLPFAMGNTYDARFLEPRGWTFDAGIHAEPFFGGPGFVGVKLLGGSAGRGSTHLFTNLLGGGVFGEARDLPQLWRYLSGSISPAAGDAPCAHGPAQTTHLCYINNFAAADTRMVQSAALPDLLPGRQVALAVAYVFAAPVRAASHVVGTEIKPGDPLRFADPAQLASVGANLVDSIAGFLDYSDVNGDGVAQQDEYVVQRRSLLDKALVAQRVFDNQFVLPVAPEAPEFHLIPGSNQVTIVWRPSASEDTGDPYFELASSATVVPPHGGPPVANVLYDPNFRQFDVEGYRVYRGRTADPAAMTLLASFDYAGTVMRDYAGTVANSYPYTSLGACAPELGLFSECAVEYVPAEFQPGVARTVWTDVPLNGVLIQVRGGDRFLTSRGDGFVLRADTAAAELGGEAWDHLQDTGVPFLYADKTVRNSFRYFYSVVAFDVNSYASGPSSQESVRIVKEVVPRPPATDREYGLSVTQAVYGRGVELTDTVVPTLDPVKGTFSKSFPPANAWSASFPGYVRELMSGEQQVTVRLDSVAPLGNAYGSTASTYWVTVNPGGPDSTTVSFPLLASQSGTFGGHAFVTLSGAAVDPARAAAFGVAPDHKLATSLEVEIPSTYYTTSQGRGCLNGAPGFDSGQCSYQGARWFDGPSPARNEVVANPTSGNNEVDNFSSIPFPLPNWNNAGQLTGVTTIQEPRSYLTVQSLFRQVEGMLGYVARAADFNVYWGAGGVVDSVIDVTHNVEVPFREDINASWGILNAAAGAAGGSRDAAPGVATVADFGCVAPMNTSPNIGDGGVLACTAGAPYVLSNTAVLAPIGMISGSFANSDEAAAAPQANPGFGFYLAGHIFMMEMAALPADGTVWTMRSYTGAIEGGRGGVAGDEGPYQYTTAGEFFTIPRPFTAVGTELRLTIDATNIQRASTLADLGRIHTVPDPYYVSNAYEQTVDENALRFVNLPSAAVIRIYSSSGVLVDVIEHRSATADGSASWDVRSREGELVASGVYFYHIESGDARRVGRFTVVRAR